MKLKGKRVLITGATRGIGKATAELLTKKGCEVISFGSLTCDLTSPQQIADFVISLKSKIDVLINNAGYFFTSPFVDSDLLEWDHTFRINVRAPFLLIRDLYGLERFASQPIILNINSWDIVKHPVQQIAYNCSKAALQELTICLAKELFMEKILVTQIMLPTTRTDMLKTLNKVNPLPKKMLTTNQAARLIWKKLEGI